MFHATRKRGPRKHVMGVIIDLRVHECKNEIIIERYQIFGYIWIFVYAHGGMCLYNE